MIPETGCRVRIVISIAVLALICFMQIIFWVSRTVIPTLLKRNMRAPSAAFAPLYPVRFEGRLHTQNGDIYD